MTEETYLRPSAGWTVDQHATLVRLFFLKGLMIDNTVAVNNLITAGYGRIANLDDAPPSGDDLDKFGFTVYERNKTLKVLGDIPGWCDRMISEIDTKM